MNQLIIEKKAARFRNDWGLGNEDSIRLKSMLSRLKVLTVFKPLSDSFSGMAIKAGEGDDVKRFMLINSNKTLGHQHFTIGHELYHLFIQEDFTFQMCQTARFDRKDGEEYHADLFASFLLLPENGIKSLIPDRELGKDKISLRTILDLEQYFSCSRSALLYRLKKLDIISSDIYNRYSVHIKRSALEHGRPRDLYEAGNHHLVIGDYGDLARELLDEGLISESHYLSLLSDMGMNEEEMEELCRNE